jgi:hypothetical protein
LNRSASTVYRRRSGTAILLIATLQDDLSILDRLHPDLVSLAADLQAEDLAFVHHFAVDDGKTPGFVDGDRADEERRCLHIRADLFGSALPDSRRFPADRPEWAASTLVQHERRFRLQLDCRRLRQNWSSGSSCRLGTSAAANTRNVQRLRARAVQESFFISGALLSWRPA